MRRVIRIVAAAALLVLVIVAGLLVRVRSGEPEYSGTL